MKRIPRADYVNPILERVERYMQEHPENFERATQKKTIIFWQDMGERGAAYARKRALQNKRKAVKQ